MSLQWTIIATFLYAEIAVVLLLVLPVASPQRWQKILKSRFLQFLGNQASVYFLVLLAVLVLFFLDAIREMRKYSSAETTEATHSHLDAEMQVNMRLFRAQRNFYISGFALFLSLVIRRLVILIAQQATLLAQSEAAMRQAQSATTTAQSLLAQNQTSKAQNDTNEAHDKEVTDLKEKLAKAEKALERERIDKDALKTQAESVNKEYDRLNEEYRKLQAKLEAGGGEHKKDA
ncbi:B-cell receptor-associated protein 31 [Periplaneta americana]|uniref:B-cell receptor-associated protein 31 n=1 Tax=Periplaneta americana TaxID=6978 RepID=UPI0037E8D2E2